MATKNRKEFGDDTRSRVDELFESIDDMVNRKMNLTIYGETFTFDRLQAAMLDQPPFIKTNEVSSRIDLTSITKQDVESVRNSLEHAVPRTNDSCLIEWVCAKKFNEVVFFDSEMKNGKLFPPRMSIDVGTVAPNSSVRINTGYVFKMPSRAATLGVKDGKITVTGFGKQPSFVIIPHIVCDHDGFIPTIYARDPEDAGLFTINFTTSSGLVGKLRVVLKAYRVVSARNQVSIVDSEQSTSTVFKPKDQNVGRLVNNPKPKIIYESMRYETDGNKVLFKTYDSTQKTLKTFEKQQLCIERLTTLIVSRKREWNNSGLVSLSGVFVPSGTCIAPKVAKGSQYNTNTHCLTFVDYRLNLFSTPTTECNDIKVVNGAFCDTDSYSEVSKAIRKVVASLNGLSVGVAHCKNIASRRPDLPLDRLIRLMDYHKSVLESDDQLKDKCFKSDKGMYDCKPSHTEAYSVSLYRAFRTLVAVYFASRFTAAQIEDLKVSKNETTTAVPPDTADIEPSTTATEPVVVVVAAAAAADNTDSDAATEPVRTDSDSEPDDTAESQQTFELPLKRKAEDDDAAAKKLKSD